MTSFDDGEVRKVSGSDWQSAVPTSFSSSSPSTACQRLRSWPSSSLQPSMTMSTQAQPTASTSRPSEQWGMAGAGGAKAARGALYRGLGLTYRLHRSECAILYNDRSVLENHHISSVFRMMQDDEMNIFINLTKDEFA